MVVSENKPLDEAQKHKVLGVAGERSIVCGSCSSGDFEVGDALYLGFLFLSEDNGNYMVALTCKNPGCEAPRTGIKLHESEFLP